MIRGSKNSYLTACIIALLVSLIMSSDGKRAYKWTLNGSEILVEMETRSGKMPHGIYAIDPFDPKKPQLLIPGGERPTWSPKKNFFAYIKDQYLYIVRRDGKEEVNVAWSVPDSGMHFHDPPVHWSWSEGFAIVNRAREFGSVVCDPLPPLHQWKLFHIGVLESAILPLKTRREVGQIKWGDILTTNNPTFSPDDKFMAAEVYPAAPMDLQRSKSRIMIFEFVMDDKEIPMGWYGGVHMFTGPGRRLTNLSGEVSELMPLWSPTGEWIAFTLCDLEKGYVAPVVVHPDGSGMTLLLPENTLWPTKKWFPIGVNLLQKAWLEGPPMGPASGWGFPHISVLEWSPDGKYLLLNQGNKFSCLMVAKWHDGRWWGRGTWGELPYVRFVSWGEGGWFAFIPGRRPTTEDVICVRNVETLEGVNLILGDDAIIRWMDW